MEPGGIEPDPESHSGSENEEIIAPRATQRASIKADPWSLKRGRLADIAVLLESARFHRRAISAVVGDADSQRLATYAGKILEILHRYPASQDKRLAVLDGVAVLIPAGPCDGAEKASSQRKGLPASDGRETQPEPESSPEASTDTIPRREGDGEATGQPEPPGNTAASDRRQPEVPR